MMHILYITNAFPRPWEAGGARAWVQAKFMSQYGHRVTIITNQRHYLTDEIPPIMQGKAVHSYREEGMEILSVSSTSGRRSSIRRRILNYISFAIMALYAGLWVQGIDLIWVNTPPPLISITAWLLARLKGAKLVIALGDLHPEEAVDLGLIKSPILIRLWETMENFSRRRADLLVAIVPKIKPLLVAKGFPPELIHVSTNAYDPSEERQEPLPSKTSVSLDAVNGRFLVMYTGTIGLAHPMEIALEAARELQKSYPEIQFVIVGQGDKLPDLEKRADEWRLQNLIFLDPVPRNCMISLLDRAQAVMHLAYSGGTHEGYYLPNKFFEYLGSGKPVIYSGRGEIARIIREARCGLVVPPENPQAFAEAVVYLFNHQEEAREMGRRGREYVMQHFDRKKILTALVQELERLCP